MTFRAGTEIPRTEIPSLKKRAQALQANIETTIKESVDLYSISVVENPSDDEEKSIFSGAPYQSFIFKGKNTGKVYVAHVNAITRESKIYDTKAGTTISDTDSPIDFNLWNVDFEQARGIAKTNTEDVLIQKNPNDKFHFTIIMLSNSKNTPAGLTNVGNFHWTFFSAATGGKSSMTIWIDPSSAVFQTRTSK